MASPDPYNEQPMGVMDSGRGWCRQLDGQRPCAAERGHGFPAVWMQKPEAFYRVGRVHGESGLLHVDMSSGATAYLLSRELVEKPNDNVRLAVRVYGRKNADRVDIGPRMEKDGDSGVVLPQSETFSRDGLLETDARVAKIDLPGHVYAVAWVDGEHRVPWDAVVHVTATK